MFGLFGLGIKKFFSQERVTELFDVIKSNILEQALNQLEGSEKKQNVDNAVIRFIKNNFVSKNIIVSFLIDILIDFIPKITQSVYEMMKKEKAGEK